MESQITNPTKPGHDNHYENGKDRAREEDKHSANDSNDKYRGRRRKANGHSLTPEKDNHRLKDGSIKPIEFLLYFPRYYVDHIEKTRLLEEMRKESQVEKFKLVDYPLGDFYNGKILSIFDSDNEKKVRIANLVIERFVEYQRQELKSDIPNVTILIPNEMVSLLIGQKGRQIHKIMADSLAKIIVSPQINNCDKRPVNIKADKENSSIEKAIKNIINIVQRMLSKFPSFERKPRHSPDRSVKIEAKLVIQEKMMNYIIGSNGSFATGLSREFHANIRIVRDKNVKCVQRGEIILLISGKLNDVQGALVFLIRKAHDCLEKEGRSDSNIIKMLIPNIYVTKLIGTKGEMVREIAAISCGAQIKILSNKESEREYQDCIVTIAGTLANKQDATCIILEKLEEFRTSDEKRRRNHDYGDRYKGGHKYARERSRNIERNDRYKVSDSSSSYNRESYDNGKYKGYGRSRKRSISSNSINSDYKKKRPRIRERMDSRDRPKSHKVSTRVMIPEYLIDFFQEKDQKKFRVIRKETSCKISVCKKNLAKVYTMEGERGRFLSLVGSPKSCKRGFLILQKMIVNMESDLNGVREK